MVPEEIGPFRLHSLAGENAGWSLAWEGEWITGAYADRDACLLLMGLLMAGDRAVVETGLVKLNQLVNQTHPYRNITVVDLMLWFRS